MTNVNKMTIFYYKSSGDIKNVSSQETDLRHFGKRAEDFKLILDFIVLDYDELIINNPGLFIIVAGKPRFKNELVVKYSE